MNKQHKWTAEEDKIVLNSALGPVEAAKKIGGVTHQQVFHRRRFLGSGPAVNADPTTPEQDVELAGGQHWQREYDALSRKYDTLVRRVSVVDRLCDDVERLVPVTYSPKPPTVPRRKGTGKPQSAVLLLSDSHVGLVVPPEQTLTFGNYSFPMFLARLKYLEDSVASIASEHMNVQVPELVIALLGDMTDGTLTHGAEQGQMSNVFAQSFNASHAFAQFIRNLAPLFPKVRIYDVVGNHTRFVNQHKMPTKNRYSNFDKFTYALTHALTRDLKNVEWTLNQQPFQLFEAQGFVFHASHGDHLRGGDKGLGLPAHSISRMISTTNQLFNKHELTAPNYFLVGDKHRNWNIPHATGDFIINGAFPGLDTYSLTENFTPCDPCQRLLFVHPKYGKTASFDISLKFAEVTETAPYVIPAGFPIP